MIASYAPTQQVELNVLIYLLVCKFVYELIKNKFHEVIKIVSLDFNEIRQLLATIANTDIAELTLKSDDFEITVRKAVSFQPQEQFTSTMAGSGMIVSGSSVISTGTPASVPLTDTSGGLDIDKVTNVSHQSLSTSANNSKLLEIISPMVGTFYRASAPGESPFVEVGDCVRSDQTVCIIEAMKLMNEIEAEFSGQVMEVLVENGEPVEYGQPLMRINPD
ncbi:Biotin carboxyl carrier protein of acetyl-CoA carboxylase [Richelia intracellularis HH01]|mgnify:CR=1 FL=1|uniref:Biotin carboxyl carrier protein of acetyl-CoA carboxylase n=1 Tax=Richelia intracellularis HH01 TaxID=1165094 RepID=M1WZU6_9NOST|nr:Biotin carboxyl carrier protein of acetyl-CoA carboxylase [Richelia intracellularis HH01]